MPGIDVLRGLCIIAVVLHHINLRIHFRESAFGAMIGPAANRVLFWSGYYGVIVFFAVSGFLITTWSLKRWERLPAISLRQFYSMRFARIVPCLAGLLLLLAILDRAGVPRFTINTQHTSLGRALFAALTFHINWLEARTGYLPAAWDVLWSLSVEEVFYVVFPLLCKWLRPQLLLITVLSGFVITGPFARTLLTHNELWKDYGYLSGMDGIAMGCIAAIVARRIQLSGGLNLGLRISAALLCFFIIAFRGTVGRLGLYKAGLDVTVLELGTALLLIALQLRSEKNSSSGHWSTAPLRWFGRNSYEVYLTHMLVVWPMVAAFAYWHQQINFAPLWFMVIAALSGVAGWAVARFYSEPLNRGLRKKFSAGRTISRTAVA